MKYLGISVRSFGAILFLVFGKIKIFLRKTLKKKLRDFAASRENKNFPSRKDAKIEKFIPPTRSQGEKPPL